MSAQNQPLSSVPGQSLAAQIHEALTEMLLSGALRPLDRIPLRDLAERWGVSVMPVRDAVARLVAQDALVVLPNRAVAIPLLSREAFRDLTEVRIHNEREAARLAADHVTPQELDRIRACEAAFVAALDAATGRPSVRANKALHFAVYAGAKSPALLGVIQALWLRAGPIINLDLEERTRRRRNSASCESHARLVAALSAKDAAAAANAIEADILSASEFILSRDLLPA